MPEVSSFEVFCGSIDFAVPLYKEKRQDPHNTGDWIKVTVKSCPNETGPFDGMWGFYQILEKTDLN
jgi:hypothetical protein